MIKRIWRDYPWYMKVPIAVQLILLSVLLLYATIQGWYDILFN